MHQFVIKGKDEYHRGRSCSPLLHRACSPPTFFILLQYSTPTRTQCDILYFLFLLFLLMVQSLTGRLAFGLSTPQR